MDRRGNRKKQLRLVQGYAGKPHYQHPAHPHHLVPGEKSYKWICNICQFEQREGGELRSRFHCVEECSYNMCGDCMSANFSAWHANKENFVNGGEIVFNGCVYLGELPMKEPWPSVNDHHGFMSLIDDAQSEGDLPRKSKDLREVHVKTTCVTLTSDSSRVAEWERYADQREYNNFSFREISSVALLDDIDRWFLVICVGEVPKGTCHILQCINEELGESICDTICEATEYVYTFCLLSNVDDSILAGMEGRMTAAERQTKEEEEAQVMRRQIAYKSTENLADLSDEDLEGDGMDERDKHLSVFQLFNLDPNLSPVRKSPSIRSGSPSIRMRNRSPVVAAQQARDTSSPNLLERRSVSATIMEDSESETSDDDIMPNEPSFVAPRATEKHKEPEAKKESEGPKSSFAVVQEYMRRLQYTLNTSELKIFATILRDYRTNGDFAEFAQQLVDLYGEGREDLLPDMIAFVPQEDKDVFLRFLDTQGLDPPKSLL